MNRLPFGAWSPKPKPHNWCKPIYGTPDYWIAHGNGWISDEEAEADEQAHQERVRRAKASRGTHGPAPARWSRQAPKSTQQYANAMSTEAARDDRLTPQAKSLLQVLRARCGKHGWTETTKFTLASIMSRSARSIQRYIAELVRFGYIKTRTRTSSRGLYTGLIVEMTEKVLPYWADVSRLAADLARKMAGSWSDNRVFSEETELSSKNHSPNFNLLSFLNGERDKRAHFDLLRPDRP
ncbi:helix-turn-helix domain-containing protein [Sinorhizobium fredii]|uniref:helix-turn-helix domain-containing protein n=1 Tax=Rhizobium fredii TaxID=380 RepID=UPI003515A9BF